MRLLDPETFADQPYVAGLNQGAHILVGAALVSAAGIFLPPDFAIIVALFLALVLELWQFLEKDAALWDFMLDLIFWWAGTCIWFWAISQSFVSGPATYFPIWLTLIMGAVMAVFSLLKPPSKEL